MLDRATQAATLYMDSVENTRLQREIIDSDWPNVEPNLGKQFQFEITKFNAKANGNVLSFHPNVQNSGFQIKRSGSGMFLRVSFSGIKHEIQIEGVGGGQFKDTISLRADTEKSTVYFADGDGHAIEIEEAIYK